MLHQSSPKPHSRNTREIKHFESGSAGCEVADGLWTDMAVLRMVIYYAIMRLETMTEHFDSRNFK
jgi:hypothetical protein